MPIILPSNIEYLGSKPNFTRDTYNTLEEMQAALDSGHIDEGHQTYCIETGITYRAIKGQQGLVWEDTIGNLQRSLTQEISNNERVASEALQNLNSRLSKVESEIIDNAEGVGSNTRLDQIYEWFDAQTHIPVLMSQIIKSSAGNLRQGTTHTYNAVFTWDWANRESGVTGVSVTNNGTTTTKTFAEIRKDPGISGGTYVWSIPVTLGNSNITLGASFYNTNAQGTSSLTIQPLTPSYTWSITGLPETSWEAYNLSKTYTLSMTVTGKNLAASQEGDKIYKSNGTVLKTVTGITDSNVIATETKTISLTSVEQLLWSWKSSNGNTTRSSKTYSPRPSFFLVSSTTGDTVAGAISNALGISKQSYIKSGPTEIPAIEFPANCTGIYLSPYDVRSLKVKSQKLGETTWTTNSSWTYTGTYTYNGVTYYYIGNQGIGAGNFKFKFET